VRRRAIAGLSGALIVAGVSVLASVSMINDRINRAEREMKDDHIASAVELLGPLAQAGDTRAQGVIAYAYWEGGKGVARNPVKARYWAARLKGNLWSSARDREQADWCLSRHAA